MSIRVKRDRHYAAYPLIRIALDDEVVGTVGPLERIELRGSGDPQALTAWFAGSNSNSLTINDPGPEQVIEAKAAFVNRWKQAALTLVGRRPRVVLYVEAVHAT